MTVQKTATAAQAPNATPEKEVKHTAGVLDKVLYVIADMFGEKICALTGLAEKLKKNWKDSPESIHFRNTEALKAVGGENLSPEARNKIRITALVLAATIATLAHFFPPILILSVAIALMLAFSESGLVAAMKLFKILVMLTTMVIGILCLPFVGVLAPSFALIGLVTPILFATNAAITMKKPPRSKDENVGPVEDRMKRRAEETRNRGGNPTQNCDRETHFNAGRSGDRQLGDTIRGLQDRAEAEKAAAAQQPAPSAPLQHQLEPNLPTPSAPLQHQLEPIPSEPLTPVKPSNAQKKPIGGLQPKPRHRKPPNVPHPVPASPPPVQSSPLLNSYELDKDNPEYLSESD